jgi:hypothetical protein
MHLEPVLERVWPGTPVEVEPFGGGLTNHNFKVRTGGETFVLRIGGKDTELLGIDRAAEHRASLVAAELGIGPEVVQFVEPEGYLVTRFLVGEPVAITAAAIARIGALLRRLHGGPAIPAGFDSFRVVETYLEAALARGVAEPLAYTWAHELAARIERARGGVSLARSAPARSRHRSCSGSSVTTRPRTSDGACTYRWAGSRSRARSRTRRSSSPRTNRRMSRARRSSSTGA